MAKKLNNISESKSKIKLIVYVNDFVSNFDKNEAFTYYSYLSLNSKSYDKIMQGMIQRILVKHFRYKFSFAIFYANTEADKPELKRLTGQF